MTDNRKEIPPNPPRWQPTQDPASINIPELDTSAPVHDQIEQIEQLITIKLQNIDENFSKIHHLLATKLLPAVKRYAIGTEPVREAAKFWTAFYEQAAQIRIPTFEDDYETVNEMSSEREEMPSQSSDGHSQVQSVQNETFREHSITTTESSFMPAHAAISSTPATERIARTNVTFMTDNSESAWHPSMETPLVRLDRDIRDLSKDEESLTETPHQGQISASQSEPSRELTPLTQRERIVHSEKGKGRDSSGALLRTALRHTLYSADATSSSAKSISPLKFRGKPKTPIPKSYNPYLPTNIDSESWDGVVDLRQQSLSTPRRHNYLQPSSYRRTPSHAKALHGDDDDDDSFEGLPPGMSPPRLMSPARPPRSSAELGLLGKTPTRDASARIARDLLKDVQYKSSHTESSMSTIPTPPSLSRYAPHGSDFSDSIALDTSLESMMRRVGLNVPQSTASTASERHSAPRSPVTSYPPVSPDVPMGDRTPIQDQDNLDIDSDSDSLDEVHDTAHPSTAFLMASQGRPDSDDSFGSSNHSGDSLMEDEVHPEMVPIHPFARVSEGDAFDDDDSFNDDLYDDQPEEETVFGVPPAQRIQSGNDYREGLKMLGEDLLQDTIGIGAQMARNGTMEESPTPALRQSSSQD